MLTKLLNIATLQTSACLTRWICAELHVVDDRPLFTFVQSKFTVEVSGPIITLLMLSVSRNASLPSLLACQVLQQ